MRIIAGEFRGRKLAGPVAPGVRPTSDRLRETLFNLVDVETPGRRVLDVFAGTGAVGLEALSRGAAHVTFVERDARAAGVIARNVATCGATGRCIIVRSDVTKLARRLGPERFDLVFVDPPYDFDGVDAALAEAAALVAPGGLVVLEHARRREPPSGNPALTQRRQVTAGDSQLTFYARVASTPTGGATTKDGDD